MKAVGVIRRRHSCGNKMNRTTLHGRNKREKEKAAKEKEKATNHIQIGLVTSTAPTSTARAFASILTERLVTTNAHDHISAPYAWVRTQQQNVARTSTRRRHKTRRILKPPGPRTGSDNHRIFYGGMSTWSAASSLGRTLNSPTSSSRGKTAN